MHSIHKCLWPIYRKSACTWVFVDRPCVLYNGTYLIYIHSVLDNGMHAKIDFTSDP